MATPLETIDRELVKLSIALHAAILAEDHARQAVLWDEIDDLSDRRLLIRSASV